MRWRWFSQNRCELCGPNRRDFVEVTVYDIQGYGELMEPSVQNDNIDSIIQMFELTVHFSKIISHKVKSEIQGLYDPSSVSDDLNYKDVKGIKTKNRPK
jgi:hypothetical protein